ncbi:MAG: hypothetical protein FJ395_12695 [Verrucomicrobia bacterium]|nr:hypothetical protein [Verrucomicrobiota bacterium]
MNCTICQVEIELGLKTCLSCGARLNSSQGSAAAELKHSEPQKVVSYCCANQESVKKDSTEPTTCSRKAVHIDEDGRLLEEIDLDELLKAIQDDDE